MGEYELLRRLGAGGMAEVWLGRRTSLAGASKAVAIKLLARDLVGDPAYRQMFLTEARVSMLLTHSNVVQVFDAGEIDGECYLAMEWIDGLDLAALIRKLALAHTPLPVGVVAHLIAEILRGLAYTHRLHHRGNQATIVHRDVSPHNVLVSVSGEVKLADFGIARLASEETSGRHIKGKLRYMAPEQLRGESRSPSVDLYAVGAILHELLTGERLRPWRDQSELVRQVALGRRPTLTVEVPIELARLHARLLHPDPRARIASAEEALGLLLRWPGARHGAAELAQLVRSCLGVDAPRSGIRGDSLTSLSAAATRVVAKPTVAPTKLEEPATTARDRTRADSDPTRTFADPAAATQPSVRVGEPRVGASRRLGRAMWLGLGLVSLGLGVPFGWWLGQQATELEVPRVEPSALAASARSPMPTPTASAPAPVPPVEPGSQVAIMPTADANPPKLRRKRAKPTESPTASVKFVLGSGVNFLYVKVGGHELALEPTATVTLPAGRHDVFVRSSPEQKWVRVERIEVERDRGYRVAASLERLSVKPDGASQ